MSLTQGSVRPANRPNRAARVAMFSPDLLRRLDRSTLAEIEQETAGYLRIVRARIEALDLAYDRRVELQALAAAARAVRAKKREMRAVKQRAHCRMMRERKAALAAEQLRQTVENS